MNNIDLYDITIISRTKEKIETLLDSVIQELMKGNTIAAAMNIRAARNEVTHMERRVHETSIEI